MNERKESLEVTGKENEIKKENLNMRKQGKWRRKWQRDDENG